ncbi:hypothetical protein DZB54_19625 [Herbaspirillum sp. 3R-3a1]|nr:hypothetical protein DZB54_19625 [Herbaspirillum sp. 3R-3a1]
MNLLIKNRWDCVSKGLGWRNSEAPDINTIRAPFYSDREKLSTGWAVFDRVKMYIDSQQKLCRIYR